MRSLKNPEKVGSQPSANRGPQHWGLRFFVEHLVDVICSRAVSASGERNENTSTLLTDNHSCDGRTNVRGFTYTTCYRRAR